MDPQLKLILDEIMKTKDESACRFEDQDEKWEHCFFDLDRDLATRDDAVEKRLGSLESSVFDLETLNLDNVHSKREKRVATLETAATDIGTWRPEVDAVVNNLKMEGLQDAPPLGMSHHRQLVPSARHLLHFFIGECASSGRDRH
jgi:hypothetical protein